MGKLVEIYEVNVPYLTMAAIKAVFDKIAEDERKKSLRRMKRLFVKFGGKAD